MLSHENLTLWPAKAKANVAIFIERMMAFWRGHPLQEHPLNSSVDSIEAREEFGTPDRLSIHDVLDQLPSYFRDLNALRKVDRDAYDIFATLGGILASEESLFCTEIPEVDARPHISCIFMPQSASLDSKFLHASIIYAFRVQSAAMIVMRDGSKVLIPADGETYRLSLVWIKDGTPYCGTCFVHLSASGEVVVLKEKRPVQQCLPGHGGYRAFSTFKFEEPRWLLGLVAENKNFKDTASAARFLLAITLNNRRPHDSILVRANKGNATAAWTIGRNDAKRFFATRSTDLASDGKRKRVLHYVAAHQRIVGTHVSRVREHYRGERTFAWNGYDIYVSGLGFHHEDFFSAKLAAVSYESAVVSRRVISFREAATKVKARLDEARFLTKAES